MMAGSTALKLADYDTWLTVADEVHQAAGMVTVQLGVNIPDALAHLSGLAVNSRRPLIDVALDVVARRLILSPADQSES